MRVYLDTPLIVAASVKTHSHHYEAAATLRLVQKRALTGVISGHGLAEAYAVLTRTPFIPRLYPSDVWNALSVNVIPHFEIVSLSAEMYREAIKSCAESGWLGGRIYDALHLCCAKHSSCDRIYTFNVRHFRQLAPDLADCIGSPSGFL